MPDYQTVYLHLFNRVTDALTAMEAFNFGDAVEILHCAQQETEALYIVGEDEKHRRESPCQTFVSTLAPGGVS